MYTNTNSCPSPLLSSKNPCARKYRTKAGSRRWPLHVFYNILDLAAINAWVLYKHVSQVKISRKEFILQLAEELSGNYDHEAENTFTPLSNIQNIEKRLNCQVQVSCKRNRRASVLNVINKYAENILSKQKIYVKIVLNKVF